MTYNIIIHIFFKLFLHEGPIVSHK
jgi:hypothetical protein